MPGSKVSIQNRSRRKRRKKTIGKHGGDQRTKQIRRKQKRSRRRKQTRRKHDPSISKRHLRRRAKHDQGSGTHSKKGGMRRGRAEPSQGAPSTAAAPSRSLQSQSAVAGNQGQVRMGKEEAAAATLVAATTALGGAPAVLAALGVAGVLTRKYLVNKQRAQMDKDILKLQISNLFDGVEEREERAKDDPAVTPWLEAFPVYPFDRDLPDWLATAVGFGVKIDDRAEQATSLDEPSQEDVDDMRKSYETAVESLYLGAKSLTREGKGKVHWMELAEKFSNKEAGKISEALRKAFLEAIPMERVKKDIEDIKNKMEVLKQNGQRQGPWILNNKQKIDEIEKNMKAHEEWAAKMFVHFRTWAGSIHDDMEARSEAATPAGSPTPNRTGTASPVFTPLARAAAEDGAAAAAAPPAARHDQQRAALAGRLPP